MKKLITILTIMIVLVGAVFATDPTPQDAMGTATIDVTTSIGPQYPTFQLRVTSITGDKGEIGGAGTIAANGSASIDTNELIASPITLAFVIEQITNSRCTYNYKISVKATDLVITTPKGQQIAADEKFEVGDLTGLSATGAIANKRTVAVAQEAKQDYEGALSVGYLDGKFINVTKQQNPDKKEIGTFSYTWGANEDARVGNYAATVVISIDAEV